MATEIKGAFQTKRGKKRPPQGTIVSRPYCFIKLFAGCMFKKSEMNTYAQCFMHAFYVTNTNRRMGFINQNLKEDLCGLPI